MTVSLKHIFQSTKEDSLDTSLVQPSNWNEEHELTAAAGKVLGRDTSGNGVVQELPISVTPAGDVTIPNNFAVTGTTTLTNLNATGTVGFTNALGVTSGGTGLATLPANNVLIGNGTSAVASVAPSTTGNLLTSNGTTWTSAPPPVGIPSLNAVASGALTNGATVIVNADGTVSAVFDQTESIAATTALGFSVSAAAIPSAHNMASVYDPISQKVIVVARNASNSNRPTAIVGTVSGTTISFGSPVQIEAVEAANLSIAYDTVANKVVIAYRDNTNSPFPGNAVVGTVSGTSISFGTIVSFKSAIATQETAMVYDTNAQKIVICYTASGNLGEAVVGTVSGTNITFGTAAVFDAGQASQVSACYHSVEQKVVLSYSGVSTFGRAIVGTVSGTTISFGPIYTFASNIRDDNRAVYDVGQNKVVIFSERQGTPFTLEAYVSTVVGSLITFGSAVSVDTNVAFTDAVYDAFAQKIVVAYRDELNTNFGTYRVGTVSGTSITFGAVTVFESNTTSNISLCYDESVKKVVFSYEISTGSVSRIFTSPIATNLTTENFIGFSNAVYANGATATIQIVGAVDDAQAGLTPGQSYFVQNNGSLGLTAGSPSVFAGTAVAATKIITKG